MVSELLSKTAASTSVPGLVLRLILVTEAGPVLSSKEVHSTGRSRLIVLRRYSWLNEVILPPRKKNT